MTLPERLAGAVDDESVVAEVPLGGDDVLVVTPTRTLVYRAEGLLSDETVESYDHDVERVDVSKGRRKAKITLGYGLDGEETISLPAKRLDDALHPVLAGILSGVGVTEPGESVVRTFRFSELTLVVTSHRLVKHVGAAVWDEEYEEFPYDELTGLDFEEGTVATSVVLTHGGRSERFKAPNESARAVREALTDAVCTFHDVDSLEEFRVAVAEAAEPGDAAAPTDSAAGSSTSVFGEGPDPLSASPASDASREEASTDADPNEAATGDGTAPDEMTVSDAATGTTEPADPLAADPNSGQVDAPAGQTSAGQTHAGQTSAGQTPAGQTSVPSGSDDGDGDVGVERSESGATGETTRTAAGSGDSDAFEGDTFEGDTFEDDAFEGSAFESAGIENEADLAAEVDALREAVEAQSDRLDRQAELIERLIEELRRGR